MSGASSGQPLLAVAGLSVRFPDPDGAPTSAVTDATWELRPGEVTALVGESGSGKSVSALAVLGLLPATAAVSGSVRLGDTELVGADARTLRRVRGAVVSLVSQEPMSAWNPVLTIGDQVIEAMRAHGQTGRRAARERVSGLLREAGLDEADRVARSYPHELSGGQLQRALIAMALAQDASVIVADEPTTALDVTVQAGVLGVLRRLVRDRGKGLLLITHDMAVVAELADRVVVMRGGRVVERATTPQLFATPEHPYTRILLDAVPRLEAEAKTATPESGAHRGETPAVRLEDVHVEYRRRGGPPVRAADGVSLEIAHGEVLGLVGESGSGKSTLGQVVAGLLRPTSGRIEVAGADPLAVRGAERTRLRRMTGVVFQDPFSTLNPRWTVGRSVAEPLALHTRLSRDARRDRVSDLLASVRLDPDLAGRHPGELSGGQRQRVAIARALALDPAVLIADEPTSALDVSVQAQVLALLAELQERLGFSCLFISHDLAVVAQVADSVAVMRHGRIVEHGPAARVLGRPEEGYTRELIAAVPQAPRRGGGSMSADAPVARSPLPRAGPGAKV